MHSKLIIVKILIVKIFTKENKKSKGVKKYEVKKLKTDNYERCLFENKKAIYD